MKKNDIAKLRELSLDELLVKLMELKKEFSRSKMLHAIGRLKNTRSLAMGRDEQAVILTVMKEKRVQA